MGDNIIGIELVLTGSGASKVKGITTATKNLEIQGKKSFANFGRAFDVMSGVLGAGLVQRGITAISNAITQATTDFFQFDKAVAEVNSILGKTVELTEENKDQFVEFSNQFGGGAADQVKAFYQIVSAGVSDTSKAMDLLEISNKAAVAGITEVRTAADALTSILASYEKSGIDATAASDILFTAVKEGKTTFGELSTTIGRVAPIAAAVGVGFDELGGTLAFLTKSGISTEEAVTGLRALLSAFLKPTQEATKVAKQFGIDLSVGALQTKGLSGSLKDIIEKTNNSTAAFGKLFPNVRALIPVTAIAKGNFDDFQRILNETANASGATEIAFKTIAKSASFEFETLGAEITNFSLSFVKSFEEVIIVFIRAAKEIINGGKGIIENVDSIIDGINILVITLDALLRFGTAAFRGVEATVLAFANTALIALAGIPAAIDFLLSKIPIIGDSFGTLAKEVTNIFSFIAGETERSAKETVAAFTEDTTLGDIATQLFELQQKSKENFETNKEIAEATSEATRDLAVATDELSESKDILSEKNEKLSEEREKQILQIATQIGSVQALESAELKRMNLLILAEQEGFISKTESDAAKIQLEQETDKKIAQARLKLIQSLRKANETATQQEIIMNKQRIQELINDENLSADARLSIQQRLADQEKRINTERLNAGKSAFGALASFQNAKSKELAAVGKAAAISRTIIDTFQGAQAAASSLAVIPFVGPALAVAAAAAFIAAGFGRVRQIQGTPLQGGIDNVPGIGTRDNFPAILAPGERVVPSGTNRDLKGFLNESAGMKQILSQINEKFGKLSNQIIVNIGDRQVINVVNDAIQDGRILVPV